VYEINLPAQQYINTPYTMLCPAAAESEDSWAATSVPEPSVEWMSAAGFAALALFSRRRRARRAEA
jgi:hypothetical protein